MRLVLVKQKEEIYASIVDLLPRGEYVSLSNAICVAYEWFNAIGKANDVSKYINLFNQEGTLDKKQFDYQVSRLGNLVIPKIETKYDAIIFYDLPDNLPTE
jgi:hypothetical protein